LAGRGKSPIGGTPNLLEIKVKLLKGKNHISYEIMN